MTRKIGILVAVVLAMAMTVTAALAVGPDSTTRSGGLHFQSGPDATVSNGTLTVSGNVAGAGTSATGTLTATQTIVTGCINRGAKDQQPSGLEQSSNPVGVSEPLPVTRQGRASFSLSISAGPLTRECPDRMVPVLVSVAYTNITLTVTSQTGTVTAFWAGPL
jgi:hypothetical protein